MGRAKLTAAVVDQAIASGCATQRFRDTVLDGDERAEFDRMLAAFDIPAPQIIQILRSVGIEPGDIPSAKQLQNHRRGTGPCERHA